MLTLRSKFCSTFSGTLGSSSAEPNSNVSITVLILSINSVSNGLKPKPRVVFCEYAVQFASSQRGRSTNKTCKQLDIDKQTSHYGL